MSSNHPDFYCKFLKFTDENMARSASDGNGTGVFDFDLAEDGETKFVYNMLTAGNVVKYELTKIKLPE